jgi:hypothetical protein
LKVDRYVKDLIKKLDSLSGRDGYNDGNIGIVKDDDYYIERGTEPPRFAAYRETRAKKSNVSGLKVIWKATCHVRSSDYRPPLIFT